MTLYIIRNLVSDSLIRSYCIKLCQHTYAAINIHMDSGYNGKTGIFQLYSKSFPTSFYGSLRLGRFTIVSSARRASQCSHGQACTVPVCTREEGTSKPLLCIFYLENPGRGHQKSELSCHAIFIMMIFLPLCNS